MNTPPPSSPPARKAMHDIPALVAADAAVWAAVEALSALAASDNPPTHAASWANDLLWRAKDLRLALEAARRSALPLALGGTVRLKCDNFPAADYVVVKVGPRRVHLRRGTRTYQAERETGRVVDESWCAGIPREDLYRINRDFPRKGP